MAVITLLTDFGLQDEYVGVLKGVIAGINPAAIVIDICHGIAPQDLVSAAYMLKAAFAYFPSGILWPSHAMGIFFWPRIMACWGL